MDSIRIDLVMAGGSAPLTPDGEESAIRKSPVHGPVEVTVLGLAGDAHVYHRHGGPEKAILHYAAEHYSSYRARFDQFVADINGPRRGFGENISTHGMSEETVCVGDRYQVSSPDRDGSVVLEVSGFRQPCWKLGYNSGVRELPALMQVEGTPGWYYRVLQPGSIAAGDTFTLLDRPHPEWPVGRLARQFYGTPLARDFLEPARALPALASNLRDVIDHRIETGTVEPWDRRLYGGR